MSWEKSSRNRLFARYSTCLTFLKLSRRGMEGQSLFSVRRGKRYKHYSLSIIEKQNKTKKLLLASLLWLRKKTEGLVLLGNSITAGLLVVLFKVNYPMVLEKNFHWWSHRKGSIIIILTELGLCSYISSPHQHCTFFSFQYVVLKTKQICLQGHQNLPLVKRSVLVFFCWKFTLPQEGKKCLNHMENLQKLKAPNAQWQQKIVLLRTEFLLHLWRSYLLPKICSFSSNFYKLPIVAVFWNGAAKG